MISHHQKCIFVHIPKNAGQSIEQVFVNLLNLEWKTRAPLLLRYNDRPELGPPRLAHLTANEYVTYKYLTQEMFDSYFKFSFVRNPWGRMISIYKYLGFDRKHEFKYFLDSIFRQSVWKEQYWFVRPQSDFLCSESGEILVDFVGRFENLQTDFNYVCQRLGLSPIDVPHMNQTTRGHHRLSLNPRRIYENLLAHINEKRIPKFSRYQDYYDIESIEIVAELYKQDITLFEYVFEEPQDNTASISQSII